MRDWGENFEKFSCLFIQTLQLFLFYIDLEVSQLWQSPSDQAGFFSVLYRITPFPHPAGTTTTVFLQSVIEAVLYKIYGGIFLPTTCNKSMFLKTVQSVLYKIKLE